jgi:hexokinase
VPPQASLLTCLPKNLNISLQAIINDGSATLLSRAYTDQSTRFGLILGTGTNAAIHIPVSAIGPSKFGTRPQSWHDRATHVLVNTELSMFGGAGILPTTRWDDHLNLTHMMPDFQPLEYMTTGRYLGEIVRLIIVEAVETSSLFNGKLPPSLRDPYTLDTAIVAAISTDDTHTLSESSKLLQSCHPLATTPTPADLVFIRSICQAVARRAAAYLATSIHALWQLKNGAEASAPESDPLAEEVALESCGGTHEDDDHTPTPSAKVTIAYNGSVMEKFPGFRDACQRYISEIITYECGAKREDMMNVDEELAVEDIVVLEPALEAPIFGAAVAVACLEAEDDAPE